MNHSLRWGLMLMLVLVLSLTACTRTQDDVLAENSEAQATQETSESLFGAPEGEGDAAAEAAAVEAPTEGEAAPVEGEAAPVEGEAAPVEGEAAPVEGEVAPAEGDAAADAAGEAGMVETTTEGEGAPEPQATTIAIDVVTAEDSGDGTAAPEASGDVYVVAEGDTLLSIAESNATSVDELRTLNNLTSNFIYVGQELQVPSQVVQVNDTSGNDAVVETTAESSDAAPAEGDSASTEGDSAEGEAPVEAAAESSDSTDAPAESASTTTTDGSGNIIHVVQENEWVYDIARKYEGVSPQDILDANPLANPDIIQPGIKLTIPVK